MSLRPFAVVLWTLGFLALAELGLEWRAHARGWETPLFGAPPYAQQDADSPFGPTEDYPFRSRRVPLEVPEGTLRVWIASASYGEHIFLPAEQIFPVVLEDLLRERGYQVQVLNASRDAMTARSAVDDLEQVAPAWRPDIVVLYHMSNDLDGLSTRLMATDGAEVAEQVIAAERARIPAAEPDRGPWPTRAARHTTIYEQAKNQIGSRLTPVRMLADEIDPGVGQVFGARVRDFIHAAREIGALPVLCSFATSHPEGDPDPFPAAYKRNLYRHNSVLSVDGWRAGAAAFNRQLRQVAKDESAPLIDVAGAVEGHAEWFVDFVHFKPQGHAEVARAIADGLAPLLDELATK